MVGKCEKLWRQRVNLPGLFGETIEVTAAPAKLARDPISRGVQSLWRRLRFAMRGAVVVDAGFRKRGGVCDPGGSGRHGTTFGSVSGSVGAERESSAATK